MTDMITEGEYKCVNGVPNDYRNFANNDNLFGEDTDADFGVIETTGIWETRGSFRYSSYRYPYICEVACTVVEAEGGDCIPNEGIEIIGKSSE